MLRSRFGFLDHQGPIPLAHRGGGKERPENTMASFSHAWDLGFRYMETDVRVTSDGVVVVMHDPVLDRVTDRSGAIMDLTWAEVAAARIGTESVPRFDELLAAWPDARWNIDAKHDAVVEPLIEHLRRANALERVCVASFSDERVARLRQLGGPDLCSSTGRKAIMALRAASALPPLAPWLDRWKGMGAAQVPVRWGALRVIDRRFIEFAHRQGLAVHAWTVDDPAEMNLLLDLGVDGIITDRPSALKEALSQRGQWNA